MRARQGARPILVIVYTGLIEVLQFLAPGRHARLSDFVVDALAACAGLVGASGDRLDDRTCPAIARHIHATKNPRGKSPARIISAKLNLSLVDDLDDPARARLDDHPAIIDDRIAIFGVLRHGAQFDSRGSGSPTTTRS